MCLSRQPRESGDRGAFGESLARRGRGMTIASTQTLSDARRHARAAAAPQRTDPFIVEAMKTRYGPISFFTSGSGIAAASSITTSSACARKPRQGLPDRRDPKPRGAARVSTHSALEVPRAPECAEDAEYSRRVSALGQSGKRRQCLGRGRNLPPCACAHGGAGRPHVTESDAEGVLQY